MSANPIIYPKNLWQDQNRYGSQFMAIYVNQYVNDESNSKTVPTQGTKIEIPGVDQRLTFKDIGQMGIIGLNELVGLGVTKTLPDNFSSGIEALKQLKDNAFSSTNRTKVKTPYIIFLPVPISIKTNYGAVYEDFSASRFAGEVVGKVGGGIEVLLRKLSINSLIVGQGIAELGKSLGGSSLSDFASGIFREAINPHKELLFKGINFREFEFSYKMVARSQEEATDIKNISDILRYYMHPSLSFNSWLYDYPSDFDIQFYDIQPDGSIKQNTFLTFISTCALTNLDVNYSGNSGYAVFTNGAPQEVTVTMKFQETSILTKEVIDNLTKEASNIAISSVPPVGVIEK